MAEPQLLPLPDRLLGLASKHAAAEWPELQNALTEAAAKIEQLRTAAMPFAVHNWYDAELEDDNCRLTRHSGNVTVGHWRALRIALGIDEQKLPEK